MRILHNGFHFGLLIVCERKLLGKVLDLVVNARHTPAMMALALSLIVTALLGWRVLLRKCAHCQHAHGQQKQLVDSFHEIRLLQFVSKLVQCCGPHGRKDQRPKSLTYENTNIGAVV